MGDIDLVRLMDSQDEDSPDVTPEEVASAVPSDGEDLAGVIARTSCPSCGGASAATRFERRRAGGHNLWRVHMECLSGHPHKLVVRMLDK